MKYDMLYGLFYNFPKNYSKIQDPDVDALKKKRALIKLIKINVIN